MMFLLSDLIFKAIYERSEKMKREHAQPIIEGGQYTIFNDYDLVIADKYSDIALIF